jgi:hypothetical protein
MRMGTALSLTVLKGTRIQNDAAVTLARLSNRPALD